MNQKTALSALSCRHKAGDKEENSRYAIEASPTYNAYDWVEEQNDPETDAVLEATEKDCEALGHKVVGSLDAVNSLMKAEWLSDGQCFYIDEVWGNVSGC